MGDIMASEMRSAVRLLLKSPGFTLVATAGLALGIGANVALFSVVNSVLLRPLPYHEPDRLVRLASSSPGSDLIRVGFSYPRFLEVQQRQQVFSDLALSTGNTFTLTGRGDPEQLIGFGARPIQLVWQFVGEGGIVSVLGLLVGVALALAVARLVRSVVTGSDETLPVMAGVGVVLFIVTAAAYVPALRAARVPPSDLLRTA